MLKKSYTGFILWLIVYTATIFLPAFLPTYDGGLLVRLIMGWTAIALLLLMLMIYVSEKVFWINGVTYEQAVEAGSARRKAFALRHLVHFAAFSAPYLVFTVVAQIIGWPFWIDIVVFTAGIIAAAVSTVKIRL